MANSKISDLTAVTNVLATDEYVLARSGVSNKIAAADLLVADAVEFTPAGTVAATDVQAAIEEVSGDVPTTASELPFVPAGTISATDVQAAIEEVAAEAGGGGGVTVITDTTLGADTQTISFTSISGSYTHLQLKVMLRTDSGNNDLGMRFNNDSGSNYDWEQLLISSAATPAGSQSVQGVAATSFTAGYVGQSTYPANEFGMYIIDIPFYVSAQLKKFVAQGHVRAAASSTNIYRIDGGGTWRSTSAITRVDLIAVSKFVTGSRAILYGMV